MSPGYADSRSPNLAIFAQLSDAPQAKKISAIKREEKKKKYCEKPRAEKFRALCRRDAVLQSPISSLRLCLSESVDWHLFCYICSLYLGPSGRGGSGQGTADCCHCRLTARTVINNCVCVCFLLYLQWIIFFLPHTRTLICMQTEWVYAYREMIFKHLS